MIFITTLVCDPHWDLGGEGEQILGISINQIYRTSVIVQDTMPDAL